ncbi:hypothetical protein F5Y01DRAFT_325417 [Xylaria sp. FL0043]|nr:hypothetical protein F5Y01DRAFT_325417 [Xylaria sp. FL0043]
MEALGAGANVAAFVVVAAQLSKVLYTTFISIKDGPDAVSRVTNHMQQLHGVLEQLKLSPLIAHDDALIGHIALCVKDLNQLADDVIKLQVLPDAMLDFLNEIKALVTNKASQEDNKRGQGFWCAPDQHSNPSRGTGVVENPEEMSPNNELIRTVTRLCDLIKLKNQMYNVHEVYDSDAEDIIEDLQTLLLLARRYGNTPNKAHEADPAVLHSEIRRFNQAFAQFRLTINAEGQRRNERTPFKAVTQKQTYAEILVTDLGTLTLRVTKRTQASSTIVEDTRQHEARDSDHAMVVTFMPYAPSKFNMIVASTLQRHFWGNAASSISRLDVNRVLPRDAPVFEVIRQGRLEKFREMLQNGEASLRDHDEFGANLLMYSTEDPELFKFLLSTNSFDLDHVGGDAGVMYRTDASYLSQALLAPCWYVGVDFEKRVSLFLELGADIATRNSLGHSCLHICLRYLKPFQESTFISVLLEVIHLLDNGADPYSCDNEGVSVSEVAYENRCLFSREDMGSMLGDLWDSALHSCGYDIAKFRQHHQRRAAYTQLYGRKDFIALWSGKLHECPYLDDAPWPELEYSDDEVDEEVGEGVDEGADEEVD